MITTNTVLEVSKFKEKPSCVGVDFYLKFLADMQLSSGQEQSLDSLRMHSAG